ncbi:MAG: hypothetical protein KA154_02930 [Gemmatimonadaceae bacterium]|nr:hypothetical protein [Gemmatimonadaceae bacterium]
MSTQTRTTATTNRTSQTAEEILGQFYFALGQGAGAMRIQRSAIAALRARYADPIAQNVDRWKAGAPNVLAFVTQVGRLAAQLATSAGRTFIAEADFTEARTIIEAGVHSSGDRAHGIFAGPWCPTGATPEPISEPMADHREVAANSVAPRAPIAAVPESVN